MGAWVLKRGPMLYDINGPCEGRYEEGENTSKWMQKPASERFKCTEKQ